MFFISFQRFDLSLTPACSFFSLELQSLLEEGGNCIVLGQPIPLDRMMVKNIDSLHITGMLNLFTRDFKNCSCHIYNSFLGV